MHMYNKIIIHMDMKYIKNTSWKVRAYDIYARVVDVSEIERVRFLIQKRVRKYWTKHFPWGTAFIIYILRFKFMLIVFNDKLEGS